MAYGRTTRALLAGSAFIAMTACEGLPDFDLRDLGNGFDTSNAVTNLPDRPSPDDRGVISYPNYQVVVARQDDTIRTIAARLGLDPETLARFNGIALDTPLRRDEVVALPTRVTEPSPATGAATTGPIQPLDVAEVATTALDRVGEQPAVTTGPLAPAAAPAGTGTEPIRHQVQRGETAFSISRLYDVPVRNIADWNSLSSDLAVREGQQLLIPQGGAPAPAPAAPAPVEEPGTGSVTPLPPSASAPLPVDDTSPAVPAPEAPEAPDLGTPSVAPPAAPAASTVDARFAYPVQGSIIRAYAPGRNEGIDIGVPAGTPVKAAGAGTVAAVTTDTQGVAIVVIKHPDNLLTVYTNIDNLTVAKDASVRGGQTIGEVRAGSPSFLHFEVRRGLQSVDPADFLP